MSSSAGGGDAPPPSSSHASERSLLIIVLDASPVEWGARDLHRRQSDRARLAANKRSIGPATLDDTVASLLAFCLAFSSLNRENALVVVGVADDETAVLYPRKGGEMGLGSTVHDGSDVGGKVDPRGLHDGVKRGVAELTARAAVKAERAAAKSTAAAEGDAASSSEPLPTGAALASGISIALCIINRFMVAAHGGVSALSSGRGDDVTGGGDSGGGGVLAMLESSTKGPDGGAGASKRARKAADDRDDRRRIRGMLTPRILVVQATEDRTGDYNALMNCSFACQKSDVALDGCFIPSGLKGKPKTSPYLEQMCDRTGGVFLTPSGAAQVGGALTEVVASVFLPPLAARRFLNLPALIKVDFRARCFETGVSVDVAHVCNQCLSIFKNCPKEFCPTCGAEIRVGNGSGNAGTGERSAKRLKQA